MLSTQYFRVYSFFHSLKNLNLFFINGKPFFILSSFIKYSFVPTSNIERIVVEHYNDIWYLDERRDKEDPALQHTIVKSSMFVYTIHQAARTIYFDPKHLLKIKNFKKLNLHFMCIYISFSLIFFLLFLFLNHPCTEGKKTKTKVFKSVKPLMSFSLTNKQLFIFIT